MLASRRANQAVHGTHLKARELLEFATRGSAYCLGRSGELGELSPGSAGDIAVWPLPETALGKAGDDLLEAWLDSGPGAPRHTIVQGSFLVRDGVLQAPRYEEMQKRHDHITANWQKFVDSR
jgi:cytosine/adenosine deaminase-related metal-dependent hydrolase